MRIAIVEPYFGGSHRAWAEGYRGASRHDVELITHDARFWKWRMQGSHVTLAELTGSRVRETGSFDVIVASSMLDLAGFLGLLGAYRADAVVALYMHENQLTYPSSPRSAADETHAMINWTSMVAADAVFFNSRFHHDAWFAGIVGLLRRFPDNRHDHLVESVAARSEVLPLGVDLARFDGADRRPAGTEPVLLWNHRWEHDKGPEVFMALLRGLVDRDRRFGVIVTGGEIPSIQDELGQLRTLLGDRLVHAGHVEDQRYIDLLTRSDLVISTARQEFFGIAVTEAAYAGALPVLPRTLVYPERIPAHLHEACLYSGVRELIERCEWVFEHRAEAREIAETLRPIMAAHDWSRIAPMYDDRLESLTYRG